MTMPARPVFFCRLLAVFISLALICLAPAVRAQEEGSKRDAAILNSALTLEHQIIVAYQISADTGLLGQQGLNMTLLFQSHHRAHRDALIAALNKLGVPAVTPKSTEEYVKELDAAALKTEKDVLEMQTRMELAVANGYIGILPSFEDRELARLAGRFVADDTLHWTALISTLQKPLPVDAMTFGAQQTP